MSSEGTNLLLEAKKISKTYRVWRRPIDRFYSILLDALARLVPSNEFGRYLSRKEKELYRPISALKPISLKIAKGEAVGVIGRNGAGKSTLLQILTGSLTQSEGYISRSARIAALLELGSGFDHESTGIENVRINASLLGLSKDEIESKMDSILNYANIGDFVYQPVRTYSSGMRMRLAFAVAAHVEADVIIIDEALGVGDARFQLKCSKTIEGHLKKGRALLFVSHNMNAVKQLCDRAILLHQGEMLMEGGPNDVANIYSRIIAGDSLEDVKKNIQNLKEAEEGRTCIDNVRTDDRERNTVSQIQTQKGGGADVELLRSRLATLSDSNNQIKIEQLLRSGEQKDCSDDSGTEFGYGGELGRIENIKIESENGVERLVYQTGEVFTVTFDVEAKESFDEPIYALTFKDPTGREVYVCNTLYRGVNAKRIGRGEKKRIRFTQKMNLMQGDYFLSFGFVVFVGEELLVIHRRYDAVKLQVLPEDKCHGVANMDSRIEILDSN